MNVFRNFKLRTKLIVSFTMVLALTVLLGVISLAKLPGVRATTVDMAENWLPSVRTLAAMRNDAANQRRFQLRSLLAKTDEDRNAQMQLLAGEDAAFKKDQAVYLPMISSPEERKISDEIAAAYGEYSKSNGDLDQLFKQKNFSGATDFVAASQKAIYEKLAATIADDIKLNNDGADQAEKSSTDIYASARWWVIAVLVGAVATGMILAMLIAGMIARPVAEVREVAQRIADGDLTGAEIDVRSKDEIGDLAAAMNKMQSNLVKMIIAVSENAQQVANASEEFSAVSQQISSNSEETTAQANIVSTATDQVSRNVQTVATGAEEMSATIKEIAKNATESARVAGQAVKTAESTNRTISKLGRQQRRDRQGHQGHHLDRRANQPAGLECNHRSRTRRGSRQRIRRGRQRSEGIGEGNGQSDRGYQPARSRHSVRHWWRGGRDRAKSAR